MRGGHVPAAPPDSTAEGRDAQATVKQASKGFTIELLLLRTLAVSTLQRLLHSSSCYRQGISGPGQ